MTARVVALMAARRAAAPAAAEIQSGGCDQARVFVLVAGPPGSGKSTLAAALATELELPLIAKDVIKQALMDELGLPETVPDSRRLGRAAVMAMLTVAACSPGAVLDSTFYPHTVESLQRLRPPLVEIRCRCPREIVEARYRSRDRHPGHLDDHRTPDELWNGAHLTSLGLGPLAWSTQVVRSMWWRWRHGCGRWPQGRGSRGRWWWCVAFAR